MERCIGPEFIEKFTMPISKTTDPNTIPTKPNGESNEYEPYYYVHDYIAQFAVVVNTKSDFGGAYNNREYGFHYLLHRQTAIVRLRPLHTSLGIACSASAMSTATDIYLGIRN